MTSDPKGSSPPGVAGGRRKRPAMTIDATATEVRDAPESAAAAVPDAAGPSPSRDNAQAEAPSEPVPAAVAEHAELAAAPPLDREPPAGAATDAPPPGGAAPPPETAVPPPPS